MPVDGLHDFLKQSASQEGFVFSGGVDLMPALTLYHQHFLRYESWVQQGFHGEMKYLERGLERRRDPRNVFSETKSVFVVGYAYSALPAGEKEVSRGPRFARYLRGRDYHDEIPERLQRILLQAKETWPDLKWKICVDTSAVLERTWGALAGLGWIGKNTLLIHPQFGSYFLLGTVLLSEELGAGPVEHPNYCGKCERCLRGCPTQAFQGVGVVNSNRCISYLTLEKRGEWTASFDVLQKIAPWVAGCDVCQEVCPFNQKPLKREGAEVFAQGNFKEKSGALEKTLWDELRAETDEAYLRRIQGTSLDRIKPIDFKRNLATARNPPKS